MSDNKPTEAGDIQFTPLAPEFIKNPYPFYSQLREAEPIHWSPLGFWVASRHADISQVLKDKRFGKLYVRRMTDRYGPEVMEQPLYAMMSRWMLTQDPPDHTRLRGLVVKAFTARRVEAMRPRIQELVDGLIDAVQDSGEMDLIWDFAHPLPTNVICDMLGIPDEDRAQFTETSKISGRLIDPTPMSEAELEEANANNEALVAYFQRLFELRRKEPGDDLTTLLVQVEDEGERLSEDELIANIILLFGAGHETTVNLIGNGLLALHQNPDQLARLKADPSLIPNAVDELLRYDSSVQMTTRTALQDVELGGVKIKEGEAVLALLGAANRDPEAYEDPDRLDVGRPDIRPSSFGGGIHYCLGAQLAKIEAEIALSTLFRRLPDLVLTGLDQPDWRPTFTLRGLQSLPARWTVPSRSAAE
ncbi:MAG: cytochrome P450 [Minwuiales bacterium]|nr:cytochrome P450 [Minwuiales bacterium]